MPTKPACLDGISTLWRRFVRSVGHISFRCLTLVVIAIGPGVSHAAANSAEISGLCDLAAKTASKARSVPYDVLQSISRAETGRASGAELRPWPWTVNMEGTGKWFQNEDDARAYVFKHFKRGARSFDIGCFQINYKWHGSAFRSVDEMFDPLQNAHYAAGFLAELYQEYGDWSAAAGAYHSRTPAFATPYAKRFDKIRNTIATDQSPDTLPSGKTEGLFHANDAGLFTTRTSVPVTARGPVQLGSLVPMPDRSRLDGRAFIVMN